MSDIAPIPSASPGSPLYGPAGTRIGAASSPAGEQAAAGRGAGAQAPAGRAAEGQERAVNARPSDRVDISERARLLGKLAALPPIRQDLVARIRDQIAAGEYDTPERFDAALEQLLEELG